MPAVTYYNAMQVMSEHEHKIMSFLEDVLGEIPTPPERSTFSETAVFYLSSAVELWVYSVDEKCTKYCEEMQQEEMGANNE